MSFVSVSLQLHALLFVVTLVAVVVVVIVVEPTLYRRKYVDASCIKTNVSLEEKASHRCRCGTLCTSVKPCLKVVVDFSVHPWDESIRFFSNQTEGTEILLDKLTSYASNDDGSVCSNTDCFSDPFENERSSDTLLEKIRDFNASFSCRVNIDASHDSRVILTTPEEGVYFWAWLVTPWVCVYLVLLALAVWERRNKISAPQTPPAMAAPTMNGLSKVNRETGSTELLVHDEGKFSVEFVGTSAKFRKRSIN